MTKWTTENVKRELDRASGAGQGTPASERKRQRIVAAATELFAGQGYRKTSIDEVARHAGVAKGTVYLYARNKADLLMQVLIDEKRRSMAMFADVLEPGVPARERLRRWVRASVLVAPQLPLSSKLISGDRELLLAMEELEPEQRAALARRGDSYVAELLAEAMRPARLPKAELTERAQLLQAVLLAVLMGDQRARQGLPLERMADLLADLVLGGVLAAPGETKSPRKKRS